MALRKIFTFSGKSQMTGDFWTGETKEETIVADCYVKVVSVSASKNGATAQVSFTADNLAGVKTYNFTPNMDGANFIRQAYEHLKTAPEFADAVDC